MKSYILRLRALTPAADFQGLGRDELLNNVVAADKLPETFRAFFARSTNLASTEKSFSALLFSDSKTKCPRYRAFKILSIRTRLSAIRSTNRPTNSCKVENEVGKEPEKKVGPSRGKSSRTENEEFRQRELLTTFLHQVLNDQDQVELDEYYTR